MIQLQRTTAADEAFRQLVRLLDADLSARDGAEHQFYARYNQLDTIRQAVVLYDAGQPVACGAFKQMDEQSAEIKRMFVLPAYRGKGYAIAVLKELEAWAKEQQYTRTVLETGRRQPEAIALYQKNGYVRIPNYGQYAGIENSCCFAKKI
ncbi:MAG TPA: GNAT family N-acetyltransferase [Sediminibacterium sp.]|nr:GNAT family N-acetyltransferase [Sediminibacterium sp.]